MPDKYYFARFVNESGIRNALHSEILNRLGVRIFDIVMLECEQTFLFNQSYLLRFVHIYAQANDANFVPPFLFLARSHTL